ncbi:MAG: GNAT family N-acetyltransferase [Kangiellaceae bacterium]|nr:GNAT family N-acetyltransferase [Kangiellaceae bacterium]
MKIPNSERFKFSLMNESDGELLFELDQDPEVMKYINGGKVTSRDDLVSVFIPRMASYRNSKQGWGLWKVVQKQDSRFVGWVLIRPMEFFSDDTKWDNIEIGWRFFRQDWGKGFATESARAVCNALIVASQFGIIDKITRISAVAMAENKASINIMKKLGLVYLKTDILKDPLGDSEVVFYQMKIAQSLS